MALLLLIGEDDPEMRGLLEVIFRRSGYEVQAAENGAELIASLSKLGQEGRLPDLVMSDYSMPKATGLDVLQWMTENTPRVPFILLTALGNDMAQRRSRQLGAVDVFRKPFALRQLVDRVNDLLSQERPT